MGFILSFFIGCAVGSFAAWVYWSDNVLAMRKQCHELESEIWRIQTEGKHGSWPTAWESLCGR